MVELITFKIQQQLLISPHTDTYIHQLEPSLLDLEYCIQSNYFLVLMCVAHLCFFSKYLLHSQPTSSNPLNSPYRSGPVTLTVIEICRLRLLARIGWDSEPRDGLAGLPVVSGGQWRGKIGSRVRIWERQAGQGENTDTGSQFSGYFYVLHGSTSVKYKHNFMLWTLPLSF